MSQTRDDGSRTFEKVDLLVSGPHSGGVDPVRESREDAADEFFPDLPARAVRVLLRVHPLVLRDNVMSCKR